jgi:hypothetical protein
MIFWIRENTRLQAALLWIFSIQGLKAMKVLLANGVLRVHRECKALKD